MSYQALETLHRLHDGYRQALRLGGRELLLLQEEGRVYLLANRCPHMDAPLHKASVRDNRLRCPVHGIEFNLLTGRAEGAAADCVGPLEFLALVYEGNTLGVEL